MATKSFTDTYVIECKDVDRFCKIMDTDKKVKLIKVDNHKTVRSKKEISKLLGI